MKESTVGIFQHVLVQWRYLKKKRKENILKHLPPERDSFEQALWDTRDQGSVFLSRENKLHIYLKRQTTDFIILIEQL